jgi:hypothetical protein
VCVCVYIYIYNSLKDVFEVCVTCKIYVYVIVSFIHS